MKTSWQLESAANAVTAEVALCSASVALKRVRLRTCLERSHNKTWTTAGACSWEDIFLQVIDDVHLQPAMTEVQ